MNNKVKNAQIIVYNEITFKSKLDLMAYKLLEEKGFNPQYEQNTFIIWQGFKPVVPFFTKNKARQVINNNKKLINITYTPDIYFEYQGYKVIIEMKGFTNDVYPIKVKLFRKYIEQLQDSNNYLLFELYTKQQLLTAIQIIEEYGKTRNN